MTEQLSSILGHVDALSELDLGGVEPTAHALDLENVTRPDRRGRLAAGRGAEKRARRRATATFGCRRRHDRIDTLGLTAERCVELLDARRDLVP